MLSILTWNSTSAFDKMDSQDLQPIGEAASFVVPCSVAPAKRKRSFDRVTMPTEDILAVRSPIVESNNFLPVQVPNTTSNADPGLSPTVSPALMPPASDYANDVKMEIDSASMSQEKVRSKEKAQLATMRQTISSQLSLEILLKHRELRLIDQELAKCQVALEQLRRCTEIPYPALQQPSDQVSQGTGPSVRKPSNKHAPRSPAPWGVTDGPYSRHYAKWLLHDSHFDGGKPELALPGSHGGTSLYGRSTRGHFTDFAQLAGKTSRSQRALNGGLPAGFSEPKQKPTGPMILKRKSDGSMVKLVCLDCGRFDFGSAQGFINHCRIGHQRNYASHDAAAEACGELIEVDENGQMKGVPQEASVPSTPTVVLPLPIATPSIATPTTSVVHPLVRSAHMTSKDAPAKLLVKADYVAKTARKVSKPKKTASTPAQCSQAPNLAAFIQDHNIQLDLQSAVIDAKVKLELPEDTVEEDMDLDSPLPTPSLNSRHPQIAGKQPAKSSGLSGKARKPSFSQAQHREGATGSVSSVDTNPPFHHFMPLLPSPTNESTQAPSLIDDDEEMDPQSPPSSDEIDDSDVHFHIRDDEHPEEGHELRPEMPASTTTCTQPTAPSQPRAPTPSSIARPVGSQNERQLSFIAEHPGLEGHNDRKRRKIAK